MAQETYSEKINKLNSKINMINGMAWGAVIIGGIVFCIDFIYFIDYGKRSDFGNLGDLIGGTVGPIWSLAGLFFIYVAFLGQRQQLLLQKQELQDQGNMMKLQQFENTFFKFLEFHHEIVSNLNYIAKFGNTPTGQSYSGREVFESTAPFLRSHSDMSLLEAYKQNGLEKSISHYLRNLFTLFNLVKHNVQENDRFFYVKLIVSQLSVGELKVLFYHGLSENGKEIKLLIEELHVFQGLVGVIKERDTDRRVDSEDFKLYEPGAFGTSNQLADEIIDLIGKYDNENNDYYLEKAKFFLDILEKQLTQKLNHEVGIQSYEPVIPTISNPWAKEAINALKAAVNAKDISPLEKVKEFLKRNLQALAVEINRLIEEDVQKSEFSHWNEIQNLLTLLEKHFNEIPNNYIDEDYYSRKTTPDLRDIIINDVKKVAREKDPSHLSKIKKLLSLLKDKLDQS